MPPEKRRPGRPPSQNPKERAMYRNQREKAKKRGIEFLLTFDEWLHIWRESGHFAERGPRRGQYVMCRQGDVGPYAVGNVRIDLVENNARENAFTSRQKLGEKLRAMGVLDETPLPPSRVFLGTRLAQGRAARSAA